MTNLKPNININDVKKIINEINNIDFKKATIEELQELFNQLSTGYTNLAHIFNPGLLLYRGIKYSQKPYFIENIIYPPPAMAKINRASDEGEQMFYATTSKRAVLYELDAMPGDRLIIARWVTNTHLFFNNVGYTRTNFESLGAERLPLDPEVSNDAGNKIIAEYIAKSFCQSVVEIERYKLTIAIAKIHLKDVVSNKFSGLFYPTVRFSANEDNFAIRKETIDNGLLTFEGIEFIEIVEKQEKFYRYKIIDVADQIRNNRINWMNLNNAWVVQDNSNDLYFVEESGEIKAYDENGEEVKPY